MFDALSSSTLTDSPITGILVVLGTLLIGISAVALIGYVVARAKALRDLRFAIRDEYRNFDPFER